MDSEPPTEPASTSAEGIEEFTQWWERDIQVADAVQANTGRLARLHGYDLDAERKP